MKATIENNELVLRLPLFETPRSPKPKPDGKVSNNLIIAGSGGFVATELQYKGQTVRVSVNAIISK